MRAAGSENLKLGMLGFDHRRTGFRILPVFEPDLIVIIHNAVNIRAIIPRHSEHFTLTRHIVFHVAVGTHHRAHFLAAELGPVYSPRFKAGNDRRVGQDETHCTGFVAVGATDGLFNLFPQFGKRHLTESLQSDGIPYAGIVG